ncbi:Hypothetical_protein [Hexamita inflata]|uniref:Hypothetical_protein n=1 Tax=Hexamita inflata TaxID=28002 RepID=A0AA86QSV9_9EUKA|nr:Hypothetical protein HINF_LOCUS53044 [Hexamita inflata]
MTEKIYETHTSIFNTLFYENIKSLTEVRKTQKYDGNSRLSRADFDKYLMILFTMMISGKGRGSAKDNWSKDPIIRNQFIADEIGMTYDEWEEIHSSVCYGHISGSLDTPEPDIDTNIDGVESDQEVESELDYDELGLVLILLQTLQYPDNIHISCRI